MRSTPSVYVGRFAPSPTGPLHLGSLLAAVGSYLDARAHGGRWLVRMEDLDRPRVVPGCADRILATLEHFGLTWDGPVMYQSRRTEAYEAALSQLRMQGLTFECSCSRRQLAAIEDGGYPGICRNGPVASGPTATRFRVDTAEVIEFDDRVQGPCRFELSSLGDVIIRRRDGIHAYQLAVVVDDAAQNVTHVVRGFDLLTSTPWQMAIQSALSIPHPRYAHLPVLVEPDGAKLSKSKRSVPVNCEAPGAVLTQILRLLNQDPPHELAAQKPSEILSWAVDHWRIAAFSRIQTLCVPN